MERVCMTKTEALDTGQCDVETSWETTPSECGWTTPLSQRERHLGLLSNIPTFFADQCSILYQKNNNLRVLHSNFIFFKSNLIYGFSIRYVVSFAIFKFPPVSVTRLGLYRARPYANTSRCRHWWQSLSKTAEGRTTCSLVSCDNNIQYRTSEQGVSTRCAIYSMSSGVIRRAITFRGGLRPLE